MKEMNKLIDKDNVPNIVWIGQGGFIFKTREGKVIVADPYLSHSVEKEEKVTRLQDICIEPEDIDADLVLCTHDHLDHTDPETLIKISKGCRAKFAGPTSSYQHMEKLGIDKDRLIRIDRGETKVIDGIKIRAVYTKHIDDSVGYIFWFNNMVVYLTGDTEYDEKLTEVKIYEPEIMLVCINGKWGNMNVEEAVKITREVQPKVVIPMHYGMFKENTADPEEFVQLLKRSDVVSRAVILECNKPFLYPPLLRDGK